MAVLSKLVFMNCNESLRSEFVGPLLFALYVSAAANLISKYAVNHLQYADDTLLYIALHDNAALTSISQCFNELHWFYFFNSMQ